MLLCVGVNVTVKKIQTVTAHLKPLHYKQQACSLTHSRHFFMNQITSQVLLRVLVTEILIVNIEYTFLF